MKRFRQIVSRALMFFAVDNIILLVFLSTVDLQCQNKKILGTNYIALMIKTQL